MLRVLIWCHGGCFGGGSPLYDAELRNYLTEHCQCKVVAVNFSLTDYSEACVDILTECMSEDGQNIILGGISSGGLMAHRLAEYCNLPVILVCPVIKPASRHASLPEDLQAKQLKFFHTLEDMQRIEDDIPLPRSPCHIIYGTNDNRANGFYDWLTLKNVTSSALDRGHDICNDPPRELIAKQLNDMFETASRT